MYIVMVHFIVGICDLSWPVMASKTEKYHVLVIFCNFLTFFCKFKLTNGLYSAPGPQKFILYWGILEARWPSNGGHELLLNKPLHDVPFWASHLMYIVMVHFIVGICDLSWPLVISMSEVILEKNLNKKTKTWLFNFWGHERPWEVTNTNNKVYHDNVH